MRTKLKLFAALGLLALDIGCATVAGGLIGRGIGDIAGNEKAGTLIGAGVGMMIDVMD